MNSSVGFNELSLEGIKRILNSQIETRIGYLGERRIFVLSSGQSFTWDSLALKILQLKEGGLFDRITLTERIIEVYDQQTRALARETRITRLLEFFRTRILCLLESLGLQYFASSQSIYSQLAIKKSRLDSEYSQQQRAALQAWMQAEPNEVSERELFCAKILSHNERRKAIKLFDVGMDSSILSITSFPDSVYLPHVEILDISGFRNLKSFPANWKLPNLKQLKLANCEAFESFPDDLDLSKVEIVDLSGCRKFKSFPANWKLPNLKELNLF